MNTKLKLTTPQIAVLKFAVQQAAIRPNEAAHMTGGAGYSSTYQALRKRGLLDRKAHITDAGRVALAQSNKSPKGQKCFITPRSQTK